MVRETADRRYFPNAGGWPKKRAHNCALCAVITLAYTRTDFWPAKLKSNRTEIGELNWTCEVNLKRIVVVVKKQIWRREVHIGHLKTTTMIKPKGGINSTGIEQKPKNAAVGAQSRLLTKQCLAMLSSHQQKLSTIVLIKEHWTSVNEWSVDNAIHTKQH